MNTDTPETDATVIASDGQWSFILKETCQKLERERDEAITTIEDAKRALKATDYEGILLAAMRVKEERDEAMEALEFRRELYNVQDKYLDDARRERDEAREENKKFREALEWIAERYDDSKPMHQVAMDAYEMSCTAKAALRKEETK